MPRIRRVFEMLGRSLSSRSSVAWFAVIALTTTIACSVDHVSSSGDAAISDAAGDASGALRDAASEAAVVDAVSADATALTDGEIVAIIEAANLGQIQQSFLATGASRLDGGFDAGFDAGAARSVNGAVVSFADMMIADHSQSDDTLATLGIGPTPSALQAMLQAHAQAVLVQLEPLSGEGFDLAYARAQVDFHQSFLGVVEAQLTAAAQSAGLKSYLSSLASALQNNLTVSQTLLSFLMMQYDAAGATD